MCSSILGGPIDVGRCLEVIVQFWERVLEVVWLPIVSLVSLLFPNWDIPNGLEAALTFLSFFVVANIRVLKKSEINPYEAVGGVLLAFCCGFIILFGSSTLVVEIPLLIAGLSFLFVSFFLDQRITIARARYFIIANGFFILVAILLTAMIFGSKNPLQGMFLVISGLALLGLYFRATLIKKSYIYLAQIFLSVSAVLIGISTYVIIAEYIERDRAIDVWQVLSSVFIPLFGLAILAPFCFAAFAAPNTRLLYTLCLTAFAFLVANFASLHLEKVGVLRKDSCALCNKKCHESETDAGDP